MYTILATDVHPEIAVADVDDARIGQQIFYAAGLISNVINEKLGDHGYFSYTSNKDVQENPWFSWVYQSKGNFEWMVRYLDALLHRYKQVTGKDHKSGRLMAAGKEAIGDMRFKGAKQTVFPNTAEHERFGIDHTGEKNPVNAYKMLVEDMYKAQKTPVKFGGKEAVKYRSKTKAKTKAKAKPKATAKEEKIDALVKELRELLDS